MNTQTTNKNLPDPIDLCPVPIRIWQFAVISDEDGFVNVRSSAGADNNIVDRIYNGDVVFCLEGENDWLPIGYDLGRQNKNGYLHKTRVKFINDFHKVPLIVLTDLNAIFKTDSFRLEITKVKFKSDKNKLQYHNGKPSKNEAGYLKKINGNEIWGTHGNIPRKQYGRILLQLGNDKISLPVDNLFEPNLDHTSVTIDNNKTVYVSALNSNGAGGYAVLWVVEKGKFTKRITTMPF